MNELADTSIPTGGGRELAPGSDGWLTAGTPSVIRN
jgi:hypothetical protein